MSTQVQTSAIAKASPHMSPYVGSGQVLKYKIWSTAAGPAVPGSPGDDVDHTITPLHHGSAAQEAHVNSVSMILTASLGVTIWRAGRP